MIAFAGAAAASRSASVQARTTPIVGYLGPETPKRFASRLKAFQDGLAEAGFVEGRNTAVEYRWADGDYNRLPALAADLVGGKIDVLVATGGAEVVLAAKRATADIPIVFELGGDPIALGVVDSLSRPGGNLTGVSSLSVGTTPKRLEFLHTLRPDVTAFAFAVKPSSPTTALQLRSVEPAVATLNVRAHFLEANSEDAFEGLFTEARRLGVGGLVFFSDPYFALRSEQLAALAVAYAVPASTQSRDFALAGGLMSFGGDFMQSHRQAGIYTGRILRGEMPSALPVQLVTRVELFINLKAAAALGLAVPLPLVSSADVVVE